MRGIKFDLAQRGRCIIGEFYLAVEAKLREHEERGRTVCLAIDGFRCVRRLEVTALILMLLALIRQLIVLSVHGRNEMWLYWVFWGLWMLAGMIKRAWYDPDEIIKEAESYLN